MNLIYNKLLNLLHIFQSVIRKVSENNVRGWMKADMYAKHPSNIRRKQVILITGYMEGSDESVDEM